MVNDKQKRIEEIKINYERESRIENKLKEISEEIREFVINEEDLSTNEAVNFIAEIIRKSILELDKYKIIWKGKEDKLTVIE